MRFDTNIREKFKTFEEVDTYLRGFREDPLIEFVDVTIVGNDTGWVVYLSYVDNWSLSETNDY